MTLENILSYGFTLFASTDEEVIFIKRYRNGSVFTVSFDNITHSFNQVFRRNKFAEIAC